MVGRDVYRRVSALLDEYLESLGMHLPSAPLRAVGELARGIVFAGSAHLTNAARLFCRNQAQLEDAVERLSHHLHDPRWDHPEWAGRVLAEQTRHVQQDDLIPIDAAELAAPYARKMQYLCTVRDASRTGDPLVNGYWCWGAYHWSRSARCLTPLMLRPCSSKQPFTAALGVGGRRRRKSGR